jgi:hypothetical protein
MSFWGNVWNDDGVWVSWQHAQWKISWILVIAFIIGALLWHLVLNPLLIRSGIFRGEGRLSRHIRKKPIKEGNGWQGLLVSPQDVERLLAPDLSRYESRKGKELLYIAFDLMYLERYDEAGGITDTDSEVFTPERLWHMKKIAQSAREMIEAGIGKRKLKIKLIRELDELFTGVDWDKIF